MKEQKIKQDNICIGKNIKAIRKQKKIKQIDVVRKMQLMGIDITRESLVKIDLGIQHITKINRHVTRIIRAMCLLFC